MELNHNSSSDIRKKLFIFHPVQRVFTLDENDDTIRSDTSSFKHCWVVTGPDSGSKHFYQDHFFCSRWSHQIFFFNCRKDFSGWLTKNGRLTLKEMSHAHMHMHKPLTIKSNAFDSVCKNRVCLILSFS